MSGCHGSPASGYRWVGGRGERLQRHLVALDVVRVRVAARVVRGDDVRPELAAPRPAAPAACRRDQREATLGQRGQRVALRQAGVHEAEPLLRTPSASAARAISGRRTAGDFVDSLGPSNDGFRMSPRSPRCTSRRGPPPPLRRSGPRGGPLARLVVGVRVHRHHAQGADVRGATRGGAQKFGARHQVRRSFRGLRFFPRPVRPRILSSGDRGRDPRQLRPSACNSLTRARLPGFGKGRKIAPDQHGRPVRNSSRARTVRRKSTTRRSLRVTVRHTRPAGGSCFSLLGPRGRRTTPGNDTYRRVGLLVPTDPHGPAGARPDRWRSDDRGHAGDLVVPGRLRPASGPSSTS